MTQYCRQSWPSVIFPLQKCNNYGMYFPTLPQFQSKSEDTSTLWIISALLTRIEPLWQRVSKFELRQSNWKGWMLMWLSKKCFNSTRRSEKTDPFQMKFVSTITRLLEKIPSNNNRCLEEVFCPLYQTLCIKTLDELTDGIDSERFDIIIVENYVHTDGLEDPFSDTINISNDTYELRCVASIEYKDGVKYDAEIFSRHGKMHDKWWYQNRKDSLCIQSSTPPRLKIGARTIACYIKMKDSDFNSLNSEFLKYIGGQSHVVCSIHNMPLITSINRKMKCNCGRNEHFSCPILNCTTCICKRCTDEKDIQETHRISMSLSNGATIVEELEIDANEDILIEPFDEETDPFREENINDSIGNLSESDLLSNDHYDNFVTESEDPHVPNEENDEDANDFSFDSLPSTNAGEFLFDVEEEIPKKVYILVVMLF